jgi:hypothetical protein
VQKRGDPEVVKTVEPGQPRGLERKLGDVGRMADEIRPLQVGGSISCSEIVTPSTANAIA